MSIPCAPPGEGRLRRVRAAPSLAAMTRDASPLPPDAPDAAAPGRGWRGSAGLWLDAAHALLVEGGPEAVKVMALAARLGLSRTSFYWHFADREALLAALVERWRTRNTAALAARVAMPAPTVTAAMLNLFDCWVDPRLFDSRLDFAIRIWALTDARVAGALAAEDAARIRAISGLFTRHGFAPGEADTRARTVYLTQLGYMALRQEEDHGARMARISDYALIFTGKTPAAAEIAAFLARHPAPQPAPRAGGG